MPLTLIEHLKNDSISSSAVATQKKDFMFNSMALANANKNAGSDLTHIIEITPSQPTSIRILKEPPRANTVISEARSKCKSFLGLEELAKLKKIRDYERFLRDHKMIENIMDSQRSKIEEKE